MSDIDQPVDPANEPKQAPLKKLGFIVEQEARRVLSEAELKPNPALVAAGWERRFVADARQAREAMELYSQLGYEVRAEPVLPDEMDDQCSDCQILVLLQFKTIYTRKKGDQEVGSKK